MFKNLKKFIHAHVIAKKFLRKVLFEADIRTKKESYKIWK